MIFVSVIGNCATMCIIIKDYKMRHVTNFFVFSLSFSDFLNSVFNTTFNFIYMTQKNWMFGLIFCKISTFISHLAIAASVTTMLAIAVDRYLAISCPARQMSTRGLVILMMSIWTISSVLASPSLVFSTTETYHGDHNDTATACIIVWPDGPQSTSFMDHVYQVIFLLVTYILPLLGLSITYTHLSRVLFKLQWQSSFSGNRDNDRRAKKEMRKVAKMFIVILIIFGVCWLPYHVYFLVLFYYPTVASHLYAQHIFLIFFWFAMANSAINPIVYFIMNAKFRIALKKTFPSCSKPIIGVLHAFLGQESSSNYSLGDMQLHLAINAKRRVAAVRSQQHLNTNNNNGGSNVGHKLSIVDEEKENWNTDETLSPPL